MLRVWDRKAFYSPVIPCKLDSELYSVCVSLPSPLPTIWHKMNCVPLPRGKPKLLRVVYLPTPVICALIKSSRSDSSELVSPEGRLLAELTWFFFSPLLLKKKSWKVFPPVFPVRTWLSSKVNICKNVKDVHTETLAIHELQFLNIHSTLGSHGSFYAVCCDTLYLPIICVQCRRAEDGPGPTSPKDIWIIVDLLVSSDRADM